MEYMHGGDIYTYENVTDYSVNLNPFGPGEEVLLAMAENLKHAGEYPDSKSRKSLTCPEKRFLWRRSCGSTGRTCSISAAGSSRKSL